MPALSVRRLLEAISVILAAGCASPPPGLAGAARSDPAPVVAASPPAVDEPSVTDAAAEPPPDAAVDAPPPSAPPACTSLVWAEVCAVPRSYPGSEVGDLGVWFTKNGSAPPSIDIPPSCVETHVGPKAELALLCEGVVHESRGRPAGPTYVFRVVTHVTIYVVRNKRPALVFDAPVAVDVLDKELPGGPLFALALEVRAGSEIVLGEPAAGACNAADRNLVDDAAQARREPEPYTRTAMTAWAHFDRDLLSKLCNAVGAHRWQGGRFARVKPKPGAPPVSFTSGP